MVEVSAHLSLEELQRRYAGCRNVREGRHLQTIWLLAKGHTVAEVSELTAFGVRWIEQLRARYNAEGPQALGDLRRGNGTTASILKPELLDKLRERLREPPADGGVWTSPKVAQWMAGELGLASVAPQRGWEAMKAVGWSIQAPRPRNPKAASAEQAAAYKKTGRGGC
jgi:transposase